MKEHVVFLFVLAGILAAAVTPRAGTELTASWSNGLSLQSADKSYKLKFSGRVENDWAWFSQNDSNKVYLAEKLDKTGGNIQDGTEFRRAWFGVSGTVHKYILFKADYDFSGAAKGGTTKEGKEVALKDAYLGMSDIPGVGVIQVGHQKEPFGLEVMASSNSTTFMERSIVGAFVPERNTGIRQHNAYLEDRVTLMTGFFRDTDNGGRKSSDGKYAGTVRLTGLLWADDENGGLLHIGGAYSYRNPDSTVAFKSRPSSHLAPEFVDGAMSAAAVSLFGGEGAFCWGPFRAQGEYLLATIDSDEANDPSFQGFYVYGSALLTGEKYAYKKSQGVFEQVEPRKYFREDAGGFGALEFGVRYAFLDLNDQRIYGGELTDVCVGLNWYLAATARVMLNYVYSTVENVGGDGRDQGSSSIFQTRFHFYF